MFTKGVSIILEQLILGNTSLHDSYFGEKSQKARLEGNITQSSAFLDETEKAVILEENERLAKEIQDFTNIPLL